MTWVKPGLNGGPDITGYKVEYRAGNSGSWTDHPHSGTGTTAAIGGLTASTSYQVRVRALNGETDSDWSEPGSGSTGAPVVPVVEMPTLAQDTLWSATLTVAPDSLASSSAAGYCHPDAGTLRCTTAYGELSDNDFTLDSTTYVVESLRWGTDGSTRLHLTLDRDFPTADLDNLTLQVGSDTFALDDATRNNDDVDVDNNYRWTSTQAIRDLAADAEVTVKLLHVSGDATLSGLSLSDVTLDPVFASGTEAYTASAAYSVAQVTVTPTVNKSTATVEYLGTGDAAIDDADTATAGHQADLSVGANTIKVRVTAPDATTQKTYTVTVTRAAAATDATLKSLALSEGELNPAFAAATTAYTASVPSSVARVTLTPALNDARAKLDYLDGIDAALDDADGDATGFQANLSAGANTVKIKVTAEDGTTSTTYALTITRAAAPMTAQAGVLVGNVGTTTRRFSQRQKAMNAHRHSTRATMRTATALKASSWI